jgi:hypothetical protein
MWWKHFGQAPGPAYATWPITDANIPAVIAPNAIAIIKDLLMNLRYISKCI